MNYPRGRPSKLSVRSKMEVLRRMELYQANTPRKIAKDMMISARYVYTIMDVYKRKLNATSASGGTAVQANPQPQPLGRGVPQTHRGPRLDY